MAGKQKQASTLGVDETQTEASSEAILSPRQEFRALTRNRILEAGKKCFEENGFSNTTMDAIAKRSRIGRTAIYQYFQNKSEIMNFAIEYDERLFFEAFASALPSDFSDHESVRKSVLARLELYRTEGPFLRVIIEAASVDPAVSDSLEAQFQSHINAMLKRSPKTGTGNSKVQARLQVRMWIAISASDSLFLRVFDPRWKLDETIAVEEITKLWINLLSSENDG